LQLVHMEWRGKKGKGKRKLHVGKKAFRVKGRKWGELSGEKTWEIKSSDGGAPKGVGGQRVFKVEPSKNLCEGGAKGY